MAAQHRFNALGMTEGLGYSAGRDDTVRVITAMADRRDDLCSLARGERGRKTPHELQERAYPARFLLCWCDIHW